jgi:hypothetical protein
MIKKTSVFALICLLSLLVYQPLKAEPVGGAAEPVTEDADTLLLDQYPDAYAAYSLRQLRESYSGPAIRVRRSSDNAEQDIGFGQDGFVDTAAIKNFVGSGDGYVTTLYAQVDGTPDMTQGTVSDQPRIASGGAVETDEEGKPMMYFDGSSPDYLEAGGFDSGLPWNDYTMWGVMNGDYSGEAEVFGIGTLDDKSYQSASYRFAQSYANGSDVRLGDGSGMPFGQRGMPIMRNTGTVADLWEGNTKYQSTTEDGVGDSGGWDAVSVGGGFTGMIGEVVFYPSVSEGQVLNFYQNVTSDWEIGPVEWNQQAIMPQSAGWQVTLYDWLETLSVEDVTLPDGTLTYDNSYASEDDLADLWLEVEGLTASSVTRAEPEWYTLDTNGKGIEGTGVVRANHDPKGGSYGGNPPRSWQNEPAFWYQLDLPLSGGGQGNPWYQDPAMGRRAMAVSIVDLIMHQGLDQENSWNWYDMKGKAFLGMAEAYRWAGEVMSSDAQDAYETGMESVVDDLTDRGPRAVNTNMDMFALHGAADLYMATDNSTLKTKCVEMVKDALFGYKDGELETNHKVFKAADGYDGGVFDPSGFIMEGDQPDVFYGGESIYQLLGALQAVTDRETGSVPSEWSFLEEVVRRLQEWRSYQHFYDPKQNSPSVGGLTERPLTTAGAGFSGRTSYGVPQGQADEPWKWVSIADHAADDAFKANGEILSVSEMESEISSKLSSMNTKMASTYTAEQPNQWNGWSPWTKPTPYLPPEGWYSTLKAIQEDNDPKFEAPPPERSGNTFNKTFGGGAETPSGKPIGKEYWSYVDTDRNGNRWGFFVEAQSKQGGYGGWYGGKIETFWTEETGVLLINRHGKTGCDRSGVDDYSGNEDSVCWFNLDEKAGHHVWGRDENGNGFTTLLLRGRELSRTSSFDTDGSPPTVTVNNVFNDPSLSETTSKSGEQTGTELEGSVEVENKFEAHSNGLVVTHTLTSDETDEVTELWASLPVYLRHNNPHRAGDNRQSNMSDTLIEYWDEDQWVELPFDTDNDDVPEIVTTDALRLGRDYEDGQGMRYGYVSLASSQDVRRSKHKYYDPYQSKTGVRTVHIDLHGDPGTTKMLPAEKSVSYTIQTTDPTTEGGTSMRQEVLLEKGGNLVSTSVVPDAPAMDSVFAGLQSEIAVVENEAGERYRPDENIDEIGQWNSEDAYRVYAKSEVTLSIEGDSVGALSVPLEKGWNWVPFYPSSPLPVEEAVSSITQDIVLVKDETGRTYSADKGIEVLEKMEPGEGYKIYVGQSTTLRYPGSSN